MTKFNDPKYDDEDKTTKAELVEVMQKVLFPLYIQSPQLVFVLMGRSMCLTAQTVSDGRCKS